MGRRGRKKSKEVTRLLLVDKKVLGLQRECARRLIGSAGQSTWCQQLPPGLLQVLTPESLWLSLPSGHEAQEHTCASPLPQPAKALHHFLLLPHPFPCDADTLKSDQLCSFAQPDLTRALTHIPRRNLCSGVGSPVLLFGSSLSLRVFVLFCFSSLQSKANKTLESQPKL